MSCHSTPGNLAVLGYCAGAYQLNSTSVEGEFHWLKRLGKERRVAAPSEEQWQGFLDQQAQWVAHDGLVPRVRRARLAERIAAARDVLPDGPSFFALQNLPARLAYVTDPATVRATALKVQGRVDALIGKLEEQQPDAGKLRRGDGELQEALALLQGREVEPAAPEDMSGSELVDRLSETIENIDIWVSTPLNNEGEAVRENLYQAHKKLAVALRLLR